MNSTAIRLGGYAVLLAALFAAAFVGGRAFVPVDAADSWQREVAERHGTTDHEPDATGADGDPTGHDGGYRLSDVVAPASSGEPGELSFRVVGVDSDRQTNADIEVRLVAVGDEGAQLPADRLEARADGVWATPWTWRTAGTYRIYVDVGADGDQPVTLSATVEVDAAHATHGSGEGHSG